MNIQSSLDSLKRLALKQIVENLGYNINSAHILGFLDQYIKYGSQTLFSLPTIVQPDTRNVYASDFSAKLLLGYLELYTHYIISSSNANITQKLSDISVSKYLYILFKYKEASALIEEKRAFKTYQYVRHINFTAPKSIYSSSATSNVFNMSNTLQLAYQHMLSLPLRRTKIVYPDDIMVYINDSTISEFNHSSDNKNISSQIYRKYGSLIGSVKEVTSDATSSVNADAITFTGVLNGFLSQILYFKVTSVTVDLDNISALVYETSIDGQEWTYQSQASALTTGTAYTVIALDNVDTGITFTVTSPNDILTNAVWTLLLDYDHLGNPICNTKLIFNTLNPLSYLSYNDISEFDMDINSDALIKRDETSVETVTSTIYQNSIENIIPINGIAYSIDISSTQAKYKLSTTSTNGLSLRYDYDMADINAYSNSYYNTGTIIFDPLAVENISTVSLDSTEYLSPLLDGENMSRTHTLYSIVTETLYGISEIPILPSDYFIKNPTYIKSGKHYIAEPIIFDDKIIKNSDVMKYSLKFKFINSVSSDSILYKFNTYEEFTFSHVDKFIISNPVSNSGNIISEPDEMQIDTSSDIGAYYVYKGDVNIGSMTDINSLSISGANNWIITSNKTAYMFYKDYDGSIRLAIKLVDTLTDTSSAFLTQFSGNIYGKVSMLSAAESYISPYIIKYTLSCI